MSAGWPGGAAGVTPAASAPADKQPAASSSGTRKTERKVRAQRLAACMVRPAGEVAGWRAGKAVRASAVNITLELLDLLLLLGDDRLDEVADRYHAHHPRAVVDDRQVAHAP